MLKAKAKKKKGEEQVGIVPQADSQSGRQASGFLAVFSGISTPFSQFLFCFSPFFFFKYSCEKKKGLEEKILLLGQTET